MGLLCQKVLMGHQINRGPDSLAVQSGQQAGLYEMKMMWMAAGDPNEDVED